MDGRHQAGAHSASLDPQRVVLLEVEVKELTERPQLDSMQRVRDLNGIPGSCAEEVGGKILRADDSKEMF